ncbi:hypothetical protein EMIT0P265_40546 [Pseudomonas zeae]
MVGVVGSSPIAPTKQNPLCWAVWKGSPKGGPFFVVCDLCGVLKRSRVCSSGRRECCCACRGLLAFNIPSVDSHVFYLLTYRADDQACIVFLIVELAVLNAFRASLYFKKAYVSKRLHGAVGGRFIRWVRNPALLDQRLSSGQKRHPLRYGELSGTGKEADAGEKNTGDRISLHFSESVKVRPMRASKI